MSAQHASQLPSGASNFLKNVAIVGVTGSIGVHITRELLQNGQHNITAITRHDSTSKAPEGVNTKPVNYDDHASIVAGLKGNDVLIITMSIRAPPDTQEKLLRAAKDAGIPWVWPNEWGYGFDDPEDRFGTENKLGPPIAKTRQLIKELGMNFITLYSGFWYEFSIAGGEGRYGFDFKRRTLTLFDQGDIRLVTTTWEQSARAVAKVLSLPVEASKDNDSGLTVSKWRNKSVFVESFYVNQKEMLASTLRVTGTKEADWEIKHENIRERWSNAESAMKQGGGLEAYVRTMYSRSFFDDGAADFHSKVVNDELGLPKEDFDACTKAAIDMAFSEGDGKY